MFNVCLDVSTLQSVLHKNSDYCQESRVTWRDGQGDKAVMKEENQCQVPCAKVNNAIWWPRTLLQDLPADPPPRTNAWIHPCLLFFRFSFMLFCSYYVYLIVLLNLVNSFFQHVSFIYLPLSLQISETQPQRNRCCAGLCCPVSLQTPQDTVW